MTPAEVKVEREPGAPWSVEAAAKFLQVSVRTLTRAADRGEVKLIRIGRKVLIPDSEVRRLAQDGL